MDQFPETESIMKRCDVCGNSTFHEERVEEVFRMDDRMVMVEQIPARVCNRCGDITFDRETVEKVRQTVHEKSPPIRHETLDVFAF